MRMRCLYALNTVVAVVVLGLGTGQFANPLVDRDVDQVLLPLMAVYLTCLAVPVALYLLVLWAIHVRPRRAAGHVQVAFPAAALLVIAAVWSPWPVVVIGLIASALVAVTVHAAHHR